MSSADQLDSVNSLAEGAKALQTYLNDRQALLNVGHLSEYACKSFS